MHYDLMYMSLVLLISVGVVLAFNVSYTKITGALAKQREVTVLTHSVIYRLLELLKVHILYIDTSIPVTYIDFMCNSLIVS